MGFRCVAFSSFAFAMMLIEWTLSEVANEDDVNKGGQAPPSQPK